ncbi:marine proteobacterial sortase target protein [Thalassotalea euphylliae]|uniref:Marine proteobacterial sortase target protein n=1 Tax=Thalassotalea euphylliae TaxID=1655234 RepID=A0A3E0UD86_9GAMM|nr:marine proteobacterial sortase target protein [Thalassotalea euphylliae]REL34543.1 marine proteobacterial sortase target protein [Thalassotalea euphylliae]
MASQVLRNDGATNPYLLSPMLVFNHPDPKLRFASAVDTSIDVEINGLIAIAEFKQVFVNPHGIALDGQYQFPLPEDGAVHYLHMRVGEREIEGTIMPKPQARRLFNQAKATGKKASLVNQHRPNLFTNELANIPAGSEVEITIRLMMPVSIHNDQYSLRLPSAITQRYQPMRTQAAAEQTLRSRNYLSSDVSSNDVSSNDVSSNDVSSNDVSNHARIHTRSGDLESGTSGSGLVRHLPDTIHGDNKVDSKLAINVQLNAGAELAKISSASHQIAVVASDYGRYNIQLASGEASADRSFEINWQLASSNAVQVATYHEQIGEEHFTLLTLYPPNSTLKSQINSSLENPLSDAHAPEVSAEMNQLARDMIFIIDTSGSMQGASIAQAKASLQYAIKQLNPADSFNILAFDSKVSRLFSQTQMATSENISRAKHFVSGLRADGGTEMYQPLSQALVMRRSKAADTQRENVLRQIVFITDGAVTNEFELMQLLSHSTQNYRLYTVGIGAAPNGYFMKKAAQFGRGHYVFIQRQQEVLDKMTELLDIISKPQVTNLELSFDNVIHAALDVYPKRLRDLHAGQPLQVAIKSSLPLTSFEVTGQTPQGDWYRSVVIDESNDADTKFAKIIDDRGESAKEVDEKGVAKLWARRKIADLLDGLVTGKPKEQIKNEVTTTSLAYQILSPYTSLLAIEKPVASAEAAVKIARAKRHDIREKLANSRLAVQESLQLMMPQTSLGWLSQLMLAALLMISACAVYWFGGAKPKPVVQQSKAQSL